MAAGRQSQRLGGRYEWQPSDDVTFFPGRQVLYAAKSSKHIMSCHITIVAERGRMLPLPAVIRKCRLNCVMSA